MSATSRSRIPRHHRSLEFHSKNRIDRFRDGLYITVAHAPSDAIPEEKTFCTHGASGMNFTEFEAKRQFADTPAGRIAYVEYGNGQVALFLHGRLLNGYFWRHQLQELSDIRRCIAVDLLAHGATDCQPGQCVSYEAQAAMIKQFLDSRQIDRVDLVGNDSGTAIAQMFAANNPKRVRTLTLTDGDTYNNSPPAALKDFLTSIAQGGVRSTLQTLSSRRDIFSADKALGLGYEHAGDIADETIDAYLQPFLSSPQRLRALEHFCEATLNYESMIRIESLLSSLHVPTLIAWATDDGFFDVRWSEWLSRAIPGTRSVMHFKNAKLYFPEERWSDFNRELRNYWTTMSMQALAMWARIP
jgi:pimeloyl-ACP methyl ester carboxylesterase